MDISQLKLLLAEVENPKLEFKRGWYCNTDKLDDKGWGEFLKDIIGLANGNVRYAGKVGYLIIGASDTDPDNNKQRDTFNIDKNGMLSNIQKIREVTLRKLRETCSPPLSDLSIYFIQLEEYKNILIFEIPSPIDVMQLDRDLSTRGMTFQKGTVLIRLGQDITVANPTQISVLKQEYSQIYQNNAPNTRKVLHNLPQPDYVNFIGRKNELEKLNKLLSPQDRIWTIVIDGIGGIGKSALTLEIAYRYLNEYDFLPESERFDAIIWISAKDSVLTTDGIKSRYQSARNIVDILKEISIVLEQDKIAKNFDDQYLIVKRVLSQKRTLLIIDNFETIDDESVNSFIRELPLPTKCIVTTRHRIDIAYPIRISAMLREDALSLIKQECEKKRVKLTEEQADRLYKRTAGVPLAVVWSIAQMSYNGFGVDKILKQLGDAKGDIARFCFESAIQYIQKYPAYKLLICIALSLRSLNRQDIAFISDFSEIDCDEGLVTLDKLSLVNKDGGRFAMLPLVRDYAISNIASFPFEDLQQIIIKISKNYAPSGGDAISLINTFFDPGILSPLKQEITKIVINQMWEWDNHYDNMGVSYCISTLTELGTNEAINHIMLIAVHSATASYDYSLAQWIYLDVIQALISLKRIKELIEFTLVDENVNDLIVLSLKKFPTEEVISEIDKFFDISSGKSDINILNKLSDINILNKLKDRVLQ